MIVFEALLLSWEMLLNSINDTKQEHTSCHKNFIQVKHRERDIHYSILNFISIFFFGVSQKICLIQKRWILEFFDLFHKKIVLKKDFYSIYIWNCNFLSTQIMKKAASYVSCLGCSFMILHVLLFIFYFSNFQKLFYVQFFKSVH